MAINRRTRLLIPGALLALALLSGCGSSSSDTSTIPTAASIFYAHSAVFKNNSPSQLLYTVGYNGFGQLGDGTLTTRTTAAPVAGLDRVNRFAAGGDHTLSLAFTNVSSVFGWGSNQQGQIGAAKSTTGSDAHSKVPVKIPLHGEVTDVAAGAFHSLAVVAGQVRSWGFNGNGQLGDATLISNTTPVAVVTAVPASTDTTPITGITSVAAGGSHSLALTADHKVYAWGNNGSGQLGKDPAGTSGTFSTTAELVQVNGADLANVVQIASGGGTSYARLGNGEVWFWGYNPVARATSFAPTKIVMPAGAAVIARISAGWDHLLLLAGDSTLWGWGFNGYAQLGDGTQVSTAAPVQVRFSSTRVMDRVTSISAFGNHSMARSGGVWYGWGDNSNGQLGNPILTNDIGFLSVPVRVGGL